jgi:Ca2+-binding EF-hand superfamily protein
MRPTLILSAVFAICSLAQEGERRGGGPGGRGGMMRMPPSMRILDSDQDGVLSAVELKQAPTKLAALDRNQDQKLTEDELRPPGGPPRGGPDGGRPPAEASAMSPEDTVGGFMRFDRNKDGKLAQDEVPERMQGLFTRNDANKDGILTREELLEGASKQAQSAERAEGGRGGRGGMMSMMRMDPVFRALDADQNGEISQQEWTSAPAALAKLDKNRDGQLSADEVRPGFPGGGGDGRPAGRRRDGGPDHDHE